MTRRQRAKTGKVTFVGAGPGDARLLTRRAVEALSEADFVLFDAAVHPDVLAHVRGGAERTCLSRSMSSEHIAQTLASKAAEGRHAVRLFWADPLLFGTGDAEAIALARHRVELEIVPGVGPLTAIGAFAGCPLSRSSDASPSVAAASVTDGHEGLHEWDKLATATDTLAIVCDAESVAETARSLVFYGRPPSEPAALVENVSLPTQRVTETTLGEVPLLPRAESARLVLVVGERGKRVSELAWLERRPLFGKRVLVTRAREQAEATASLLRARGADPVVVPTIEIHPPRDPRPMIEAAGAIGARYAWVVLTSANGVERLWAEVRRQGKDARVFGGARIAVVGPGTAAALERIGLTADLVAQEYTGEGLATDLVREIEREAGGRTASGKPRVLIARPEVARDVIPDALRAAGCEVDLVPVYETRSPSPAQLSALSSLLERREIDVALFTSSSTVEHLCDALDGRAPSLLADTCTASIGPITTATAQGRGLRVDVTAGEHTVAGLVEALEAHLAARTT